MNKTYKSSMMALSAVAFFTSCSESESLQQAHLSTDQINFIASMAHQWDANTKSAPQNPSSRSAGVRDNEAPIHVNANLAKPLYLHPVVQDGIHIWSKQGTPITRSGAPIEDVEQERVVQTRGSKKNDLSAYSNFGVTALYQNGDAYESLFSDAIATNSGKYWNIPDASNHTWPIDSKVSFHAYAPHSSNSNSMLKSSPDFTNVQTNIHYEAKVSTADIEKQPDLIVATNAEQRSKTAANTPVALQFSHALTAVSFAMSSDLADVIGDGARLTSVSLQNIPNEGDCQLIAQDDKHTSSSAIWKLDPDKNGTYTFDLSAKNVIVGSNLALTDDNQTLMMIPQTLPEGAKLVFEFMLNGLPQVLTVDLNGEKWDAGKSVIYKLSAKAINTLDATDVTYPITWTASASSFPKSSFTANDAIGLYVVDKNNQIVEKNVKLTLGSNSKWTTDKKFLKLAGYKYFAYYPYSATAPTVNTEATNTATDFFASKISSLSPASDQSAQNTLLAQDFQVATGVVAGDASTLTFTMEHSMGLAVLNLTRKDIAKTRRFKNNNYTYYYPDLPGRVTTVPTKDTDYTDDATKQSVSASTAFSGYIPYKTSTANRYLQIVKPSTDISFKASDESGKPRSAWGTLTPCTFNVAKNAAVSKNIQTDADFYYLARVYTCTQKVEEFKTPVAGDYQIECWGAQGGGVSSYPGGKGSYTKGSISLDGVMLYVVVGQIGGYEEAFNNGFPGRLNFYFSGGGATDIRLNNKNGNWKDFVSRKSRIMVAASGGGSVIYFSNQQGMPGGSLSGFSGTNSGSDGIAATPGVQTSCGKAGTGCLSNGYKGIGFGIVDYQTSEDNISMGSAGNGYYCGGVGNHGAGTVGVGATGSCFISGHPGCDAIKESSTENAIVHTGQPNHYSGLVFTDTEMIDGQSPMPSPKGGTETGHLGDGACIVTQLSFK